MPARPDLDDPQRDIEAIARRVRIAREVRGVDTTTFAKSLRISSGMLIRIELGERRPSVLTLAEIGNKLGTYADFLLYGWLDNVEPQMARLLWQHHRDELRPAQKSALLVEHLDWQIDRESSPNPRPTVARGRQGGPSRRQTDTNKTPG